MSIDGVLVASERASISVFDRGLLYGDGCFEVLRTWDAVARDLDAHLDRLFDTAAFLQLKAIERPRLVEAVYRTIAAAGPGDHRIRVLLTRGPGGLAQPVASLGPGVAIVIVEPLAPQPEELAAVVVDWPLPRRAVRGHKTLAYLDHIVARELARAAGADEAFRLDPDGHVVEGATSNVFAVLDGTVVTPPADAGALPGIVRQRVLTLCARAAVPTELRPIPVRALRAADEIFVTSSLRGVVPITRLDGALRPSGPVTQQLANAYVRSMTAAPPRSDL